MNNHRLANVEPEREQTKAEPAEQPNEPPWEENEKPSAEGLSIPSSVKKSHYEAEQAEKDAGEYIPVEELEDLADEWEGMAEQYMDSEHGNESAMAVQEWKCAQELREVIEQYE